MKLMERVTRILGTDLMCSTEGIYGLLQVRWINEKSLILAKVQAVLKLWWLISYGIGARSGGLWKRLMGIPRHSACQSLEK